VWPAIRARQPAARLFLVGRRPVEAVSRLAEVPGIEVVGQVPDVRPWLRRAAVSVNPLRIARGVQNKVLEALASARAVVGSPEALAGLGVREGVEVLSASSPQEWVAAVLALFADPAQRLRLGQAGREYVEQHHRWETCLAPFAELIGAPDASGVSALSARLQYQGESL
jgi:polysaccharide biosynthesis protein PslH